MKSKLAYAALGTAALIAGLLLALFLTREGGEIKEIAIPQAVAQGSGELTVEELVDLREIPVFWLGESYQGLPLVDISYLRGPGRPDGSRPPFERVQLIYGICDFPEGDPETARCVPPLAVTTERFCLNKPSWLASSVRSEGPFEIRGALAQQTKSHNLHVYTGASTIIVFAAAGDDAAVEAAWALRGANPTGRAHAQDAAAPLGPPMREADCPPIQWPTAAPTLAVSTTPESTETLVATETSTLIEAPTSTPVTEVNQ